MDWFSGNDTAARIEITAWCDTKKIYLSLSINALNLENDWFNIQRSKHSCSSAFKLHISAYEKGNNFRFRGFTKIKH